MNIAATSRKWDEGQRLLLPEPCMNASVGWQWDAGLIPAPSNSMPPFSVPCGSDNPVLAEASSNMAHPFFRSLHTENNLAEIIHVGPTSHVEISAALM